MRVAVYARFSTTLQDARSIEDQLRRCGRFARSVAGQSPRSSATPPNQGPPSNGPGSKDYSHRQALVPALSTLFSWTTSPDSRGTRGTPGGLSSRTSLAVALSSTTARRACRLGDLAPV